MLCIIVLQISMNQFGISHKVSNSLAARRKRDIEDFDHNPIKTFEWEAYKEKSKFNIWFIHKQCIILPKQLFLVQFLKSKKESLRSWNSMFIPSWNGKLVTGELKILEIVKISLVFLKLRCSTSCRSGNPVEFPHRRGCFSRKLLLWWQIDTRFVNGWARLVACFQSRQLTLPKGGSWGGRELLCSAQCSKIGKLTLLYFFGPITEGHSFVGSPSDKATTNLNLGTRQNQYNYLHLNCMNIK